MTGDKRIGILTSGGDCAGLNAIIRAAVFRADELGWTVIGIKEGTLGLLSRPLKYDVLTPSMFTGAVMREGGTFLGTTTKGNLFAYPMSDGSLKDRSEEVIEGCRELELDALIGIGGDGSFALLRRLAGQGNLNFVCVPKTIDNDVGMTELAVGFDTACAVATEALDRLQPTAASHHRVMVLEVMGRDAGHIALSSGIAGGADVILIPEIPYSIDKIAAKIRDVRVNERRSFALCVVSEAVKPAGTTEALMVEFADGQKRFGGVGMYIGDQIARVTGAETRVTVLGHVQRGCMPNWRDRLVASAFGVHAVNMIAEGKFGRMVGWSNRQVIDVPIEDAIAHYHAVELDGTLVRTARHLGICLGD